MPFIGREFSHITAIAVLLSICFTSCSDPVEPQFEYKEGLVYVDALITDIAETSYVKVTESFSEFGVNKSVFVSDAQVSFINTKSGIVVDLVEDENTYIPSPDFAAKIGEQWELRVLLPNGKEYRSEPEILSGPVEIVELKIKYDPELSFENSYNRFVPGHSIMISFDDPKKEENYYYWRFRSFEKLIYCKECFEGIFRNGECETNPTIVIPPRKPRYTYSCQVDCWRVRYSDEIIIFSDEFTNGTTISNLQVGEVLLFTNDNILVELQQFSISPNAFRYLQTLKDIVDNNSGFNSPLPAPLIGNIYNTNDNEEFVLGMFIAASASKKSAFIERIFIEEPQLEARIINSVEEDETPSPIVIYAPCQESRLRTSIMPNDWVN
ncbi:MAG: DUF4249 domain-containing protein [Maribacter sp.]|nr:DUF4249 domain-containing protein [Maribacter sp.]